MIDRMSDITGHMAESMAAQQEEWLRGLGIKTEDEARAVAKNWVLEYGPPLLEDASDGRVRMMQTVRLVPRNTP